MRGGTDRRAAGVATAVRGDSLLSVSGLRRVLGGRPVLTGLDLDVCRGEIVAVVGPNGSGKTTLLRCVLGLDRPNDGTLTFCGEPLAAGGPRARRWIAAVLDDVDFFPDLSVAEHLALLAAAHGEAEPDRVAADLLGEAELAACADQLPVTLSSGQRRRLALLTCFARPRLMVVLDEPEQRLDQPGRQWLLARLRQERSFGHGMLISTHDSQLIGELADRVIDLGLTRP